MLLSNWIQTRNKAKGRHGDPGSFLPNWVPWPLWIGELDLGVLASLAKDFLHSWVPDSPAPAWQVWWVYELILDADFRISKNYKLSRQNVNAARPHLVYSLRLSGFLHQLTHWKKGMGGTGSSWQGCWKKQQTGTGELPLAWPWGVPQRSGNGGPKLAFVQVWEALVFRGSSLLPGLSHTLFNSVPSK